MDKLFRGEYLPSLADKVLVHYDRLYCDPSTIENGDTVYCDTHHVAKYKHVLTKKQNLKIITHNSDYYICEENPWNECGVDVRDFENCFDYWFGQNSFCKTQNVIPLPIGFENLRWEKAFGPKTEWLQEIRNEKIDPDQQVYLNCNRHTNILERHLCYKYCSGVDFVTCDAPNLRYRDYLRQIKRHRFTISPEGNGLDCHRTWEIFMMERVPVIKRKGSLERLYGHMPVLFVDNWEDLEQIDFENVYNSLISRFKNQHTLFLHFNTWSKNYYESLFT